MQNSVNRAAKLVASAWAGVVAVLSVASGLRAADVGVPCEVVFRGRITDSWHEKRGFTAFIVDVDVIAKAAPSACAPTGTFRLRLPDSNPLVREPVKTRKGEHWFRATGTTSGFADLVIVDEKR